MKLSDLFDGEKHILEFGEDFNEARNIIRLEELDEDEELDPYESPSQVAELIPTGSPRPEGSLRSAAQQGWGCMSVCFISLRHLLQIKEEHWEENVWTDKGQRLSSVIYTFQFTPDPEGSSFQGGRL